MSSKALTLTMFLHLLEITFSSGLTFKIPRVTTAFKTRCRENGGNIILYDTCYILGAERLNFETAQNWCTERNAHLLSITSSDEQQQLMVQNFLSQRKIWLGLAKVASENVWQWSDGSNSTLISENVPPDWTKTETCAVFHTKDGSVHLSTCTHLHHFICKERYYKPCYPSWLPYHDKCYRVFGINYNGQTEEIPPLSIRNATIQCQKYLNGHLSSSFRGSFFVSNNRYWKDEAANNTKLWVGIFGDPKNDTRFVRDNGESLDIDPIEKMFYVDRRNTGKYNCSYFYGFEEGNSTSGRIFPSSDCSAAQPFICEMPTMHFIEPQTISLPNGACLQSEMKRSCAYRIKPRTQMLDHVVETLPCQSEIECAVFCCNNDRCKSFNVIYGIHGKQCEINSDINKGFEAQMQLVNYGSLNCFQ